jgi:hypothetical protein
VGVLKFNGASGNKPQTEARRYVYGCLATTLHADIQNAGYMFEDLEAEPDRRRAMKAAQAILRELRKKSRPPVSASRSPMTEGGRSGRY